MEGRISATGLKSVELDELTTNQIIINNEGLQYKHKYNILWNLPDFRLNSGEFQAKFS